MTEDGRVPREPPRRCWDTPSFLMHIKRLTGHDLRAFALLHVYGRGDCECLHCLICVSHVADCAVAGPVEVGFSFNKRQRQFDFAARLNLSGMTQEDADLLVRH